MKLATAVTLAVTGATGVALLVSLAAASVLISRDETADLDHALFLQAHAFSERVQSRDPVSLRVRDGFASLPESLAAIPRYVALYDAAGSPTSFSDNFGKSPPTIAALGVELPVAEGGEPVELTVAGVPLRGVVLHTSSHSSPLLLYAAARKSIDEDMTFFRQAAGGIFVAAMMLTALLARWLSTRISRAVETVAGVARAVSKGDLDARVGPLASGIAETRSLGASMDHMISQLQALVVAQRTFVSHAAHELRSPLSTLRGELQLAIRRERSADEYRSAIKDALADVDTMTALAESLLSLARAQRYPAPAEPLEPVSLADWLAATKSMVRGAEGEPRAALDVTYQDATLESCVVQGPKTELARALRNLVDNALAHTPEGGRVVVHAKRSEGWLVVQVIDNGSGILAAEREHIFEPFFRGSRDQAGDTPGAGLGLAIAREIARQRSGDVILATSSEQAGSVFELRLPPL